MLHVEVLPTTTGFGVQLTDPPAAMFTAVVTGTVFTLNVAVTVQFEVTAAVLNGDDTFGEPQLLVVTPVKA